MNKIFIYILLLAGISLSADQDFFSDFYTINNQNQKNEISAKQEKKIEKKQIIEKNIKKKKKEFIFKNTSIKIYGYEEAKKLARKQGKKIYLIVYSETCKYCVKYFALFNINNWFTRYIKESFIVAYLNIKETINYPEFQTAVTPTTFITDKNGILITKPIKGIPKLNNYFRSYLYGIATYKK